jgi:hypothetical protein
VQPTTPPVPLYRFANSVRDWLQRVVRRMVPAPVALYEQLTGVWQTEMIYTATRLGIPDLLADGAKSAEELAEATGAHPDALARLLRATTTIGLFTRDGEGRYALTRLSSTLRRDAPDSMRDIVLYGGSQHSMHAWSRFHDVVTTGTNGYELAHGKPLFDYFADHPEEGAIFNGAMVCLTRLEAPAVARGYPFGQLRQVCDVGGGRGTLLGAILAQHPHLEGVLFDDPRVVAEAGTVLDGYGVRERVRVEGGSFFQSVPEGCDAYLLKDILHDWNDERALEILRACRRAMAPDARLLVVEMLIVEDGRPHPAKMLDLQMMDATHDGRQRSREELAALFARAGLELKRVIALATPSSVVEAVPVLSS